jgi:hypothetical protein
VIGERDASVSGLVVLIIAYAPLDQEFAFSQSSPEVRAENVGAGAVDRPLNRSSALIGLFMI